MKTINGMEVKATEFFYDGCHKLYLVDDEKSYGDMYEMGWDVKDIFPIEELPMIWASTCPLRFINSADLTITYVGQCEPAEFIGWDIDEKLERDLEWLRLEQIEANEGW